MPVGYRPMGRVGRTLVLVRFPIFLSERHICVLSSFVFNTILTTRLWMSLLTFTVTWTRTKYLICWTNNSSRIFHLPQDPFTLCDIVPMPVGLTTTGSGGNRWHRLSCVPFPHLILARHSESPTTPVFLSKRHICVLRGNSLYTINLLILV